MDVASASAFVFQDDGSAVSIEKPSLKLPSSSSMPLKNPYVKEFTGKGGKGGGGGKKGGGSKGDSSDNSKTAQTNVGQSDEIGGGRNDGGKDGQAGSGKGGGGKGRKRKSDPPPQVDDVSCQKLLQQCL